MWKVYRISGLGATGFWVFGCIGSTGFRGAEDLLGSGFMRFVGLRVCRVWACMDLG